MDGREFFHLVEKHPDLQWLGVTEGPGPGAGEVVVLNRSSGAKVALELAAVLEHPWPELRAVLTGRRPLRIMTHLTRIVGYFSQVQNWNRSKIAELRDRQKGEYRVEATAPPPRKELAPVA